MKTTISKTTSSGIEVNYELRAEDGKFDLYASMKNSDFYAIDGSQMINNELYFYIENKNLNSFLGIKETQKVNIPGFALSELTKELQNKIIESNEIIKVSFLASWQEYTVEYDLDCNLSRDEAAQYLVYENDSVKRYEIPAQKLYVERKSDTNTKAICVSCQQEYDIIDNDGFCPCC